MGETFIFLGILIFSAHVFSAIFSRKKIPDVLFLMLIGIVIGPLFSWVTPADFGVVGSVFASLTLVFILFESGTDTSIQNLRDSWKNLVQVAIPSFFLSVLLVGVLGYTLFGLELKAALLLGSILGGTSSAVVIPLVKQLPVSEENRTMLVLESAITDVFCIVSALAFIESYKYASVDVGGIIGKVVASFTLALMIGIAGGVVWSSILEKIRKIQNSMFLTPAFVFVLYGLSEAMGYSGAIAALAFGIVMGNTEYFEFSFLKKFKHNTMMRLESHEKSFFSEIVFILKTFFFVYIGLSIPFSDMQALLYGLLITVVLFVMRMLLTKFSVSNKSSNFDKTIISMMIPKGLAAAVLATLPEQAGIPGGETIKYITYSVVFLSILITSILILLNNKIGVKRLYNSLWGKRNQEENVLDIEEQRLDTDIFDIAKERQNTNKENTTETE
ncbi:MAG: sodium:proton antiporter [Bacteroidales bacterium]|nr:sodium:proton antiporter [Bacteroidales bacterium]